MRGKTMAVVTAGLVAAMSSGVEATFHLMQIEQVIGGVNGDTTAQAVQLRMRGLGQNLLGGAKLWVRDATGSNPVLLINFAASVPNGVGGASVLIASANFETTTTPTAIPDFTLSNLIPASYLAAGSMTFENNTGAVIYWRLSWGGASYTGPTTGSITNDPDGDFGPPWPGPLPSGGVAALQFQGPFNAASTNNAADYALTTGASSWINNAGQAFALPAAARRPTHDILWRHDDGRVFIWLMEGTDLVGQGSPGSANAGSWEIAGVGDFDGDEHSDILWRNLFTGQVYIWFVEGTQRVDHGSAGAVNIDLWEIVGIGNFDGDPQGRADILWRNKSSGQVFIWLMNGTQRIGQGSPGGAGPAWAIVGVGDFDGDGRSDILWRNTTSGLLYIWFVQGTQRVDQGSPGAANINLWEIVGIGNFDGDPQGRSDILWRRTDIGTVFLWLMNGTQLIGQGTLGSTGQVWQIVETGDFDADGYSDILWRNQAASGQVYTWFIEGTDRVDQGPLGSVPHAWRIIGTGDFDGE